MAPDRAQRAVSPVFVADGDRWRRSGLVRTLRDAGHEVEGFDRARPLLAHLETFRSACCVVSELRLLEADGLDLQEALLASGAYSSLVFLAGKPDIRQSVRAIRRGAVDVLERPVAPGVLLGVVAGALERARADLRRGRALDELRERCRTLTRREREVFAFVTSGFFSFSFFGQPVSARAIAATARTRVFRIVVVSLFEIGAGGYALDDSKSPWLDRSPECDANASRVRFSSPPARAPAAPAVR